MGQNFESLWEGDLRSACSACEGATLVVKNDDELFRNIAPVIEKIY